MATAAGDPLPVPGTPEPAPPALTEVPVGQLTLERFEHIESGARLEELRGGVRRAQAEFSGRTVWHVNSTARGGGVAEMLVTLLAYARGTGVDARWLVIGGDPPFFHVTKRLHNHLHGADGDGGPLRDDERRTYERALHAAGDELERLVSDEDVVVLHDPQTAGLVPRLRARGVLVVWPCHIGVDLPNDLARNAWAFLTPYVAPADAYVFSRREFAWDGLDPGRTEIIPPSIDAFAPKNQLFPPGVAAAILAAAGLREGEGPPPEFTRLDGSRTLVTRRAAINEDRPLRAHEPYVLQVSRWDQLKDPVGVIAGFAQHIAPHTDAHLVYAGPDVTAVADDPEGVEVLERTRAVWHALPSAVRERVHLALLPMGDGQENAAIVNALQSEAAVVVQKSLAEGFGLTVAEAMWKRRAVVASAVGGIKDQIDGPDTGVLLDDPLDLAEYGAAVAGLLADPARRHRIGDAAHQRVRDHFLGTRSLLAYLALLERLTQEP